MLPVPLRRPYEVERLPQTRLSALLGLLLRVADLLILAGAALVAHRLRFGEVGISIEFERALARGLLFVLLVLGPSSTYQGWRAKEWSSDMLRLFWLWSAVFLLGVLYVAMLKVQGITSRLWWGYWFVGTVIVSCGARAACRGLNHWATTRGHDVPRVVVVGTRDAALRMMRELQAGDTSRRVLLGWFSVAAPPSSQPKGRCCLGSIEALRRYVESQDVRQVWICLEDGQESWASRILDALQHTTADIKYVPNLADQPIFNGSVELLNGLPVINLRKSPLDGQARVIKGIEDRVMAFVILILIMPLMALIAFGVKLSSPGPILFKQKRHGLDCRTIEVWKFRSMRVHLGSPGELAQATRSDPRVTSFGRFLRRTSLDELPQFFNVLQGTMSIVGPRPHAIEHNDYYKSVVQNYMQRHRVKPGITGWAQVNGLRGETDTSDKMAKRVEYDFYYMRNWSVLFDLRIVAMTFLKGFVGNAAY